MQKALDYCRDNAAPDNIHTVVLPTAEYAIHYRLEIYSNTVLDLVDDSGNSFVRNTAVAVDNLINDGIGNHNGCDVSQPEGFIADLLQPLGKGNTLDGAAGECVIFDLGNTGGDFDFDQAVGA